MDSWLKAAVDGATKLGDQVQKHASELGQNASMLGDMLTGADAAPTDGSRELVFEEGPVGFALDGTRVTCVDPDGQAAKLGVQAGYRLKAIAGYEVPAPAESGDEQAERRNRATVKKWLKEMPRPGRLTFFTSDQAPEPSAPSTQEAVPAASPRAPSQVDASPEAASVTTAGAAEEAVPADLSAEDSLILEELRACAPPPAEPPGGEAADDGGEAGRLRAQVDVLRDRVCSLEGDLEKARTECQELRHLAAERDDQSVGAAQSRLEVKVRGLQEQLANAHSEGEAAKKKAAELQAQLATASARCEELRLAVGLDEEHVREAFEGRERVLEDEVARLRKALGAAETETQVAKEAAARSLAEAEAHVSELQARAAERQTELHDVAARAAAAEGRAEDTGRELLRTQEAHSRELAALRGEREEALSAVRRASEEREREAARGLEEARRELEEARRSAEEAATAAAEEASRRGREEGEAEEDEGEGGEGAFKMLDEMVVTGKAEEAAEGPEQEDMSVLHERISFLESRCCALQKKLNARPIVFQAPKGAGGSASGSSSAAGRLEEGLGAEASQPSWEPLVRGLLGPRAAGAAVLLYGAPDRKLRSFTQRLLRHNAWLWLFYAHLLVLYAVAASCYAETTSDSYIPMDSLNVHEASSVSAASAASAAGAASPGHV